MIIMKNGRQNDDGACTQNADNNLYVHFVHYLTHTQLTLFHRAQAISEDRHTGTYTESQRHNRYTSNNNERRLMRKTQTFVNKTNAVG